MLNVDQHTKKGVTCYLGTISRLWQPRLAPTCRSTAAPLLLKCWEILMRP